MWNQVQAVALFARTLLIIMPIIQEYWSEFLNRTLRQATNNIWDRTLYSFQIWQSDLYSTPGKSTWKFYQMKHIFSFTEFSGRALSHLSHNYNSKRAWIIYVKSEKSAFSKVHEKETYTHTHTHTHTHIVERSGALFCFSVCRKERSTQRHFELPWYLQDLRGTEHDICFILLYKFCLKLRSGKYMWVHLKKQVKPHAGQYENKSLKPSDSNKNLVDRHTHTHFS